MSLEFQKITIFTARSLTDLIRTPANASPSLSGNRKQLLIFCLFPEKQSFKVDFLTQKNVNCLRPPVVIKLEESKNKPASWLGLKLHTKMNVCLHKKQTPLETGFGGSLFIGIESSIAVFLTIIDIPFYELTERLFFSRYRWC